MFLFQSISVRSCSQFRGTMASASDDKEKTPPEDDHQNPKLKEEVES
jgi:hypothetical protein